MSEIDYVKLLKIGFATGVGVTMTLFALAKEAQRQERRDAAEATRFRWTDEARWDRS